MLFPTLNFKELEPAILQYWNAHQILQRWRQKNQKGPKFYFLEGPPYTSGNIHLGHAWNMALKDLLLRYKRSRGFNVWDRMGYDMHGLPTEQKVMAKLGLQDKEDITRFGLKRFQQECREFCLAMMQKMNEDFLRLGATLDFSNPYQPITKEFMEAEWWLIKQAHKKKRLYQGLRTMHWDAATQSAVAKHELEYRQVTDQSIYVKFKHKTRPKTFFIVWTTTPWTIPLNLALMVHPELDYAEVEVENVDVGKEVWIIAQPLVDTVMKKCAKEQHKSHYKIKRMVKGSQLQGQKYVHPLHIDDFLPDQLRKNSRLFSVLLSTEYVDDTSGTGLVHCAPGCGPEDYEIGHRNKLPPFNCLDEQGYFTDFGRFSGWRAKKDDGKFVQAIEQAGALLAKEPYVHDYPHGERSHEPVIFRTTKQWFFRVEDLKEKIIAANEDIYWNPQSGKNAFRSWLENLRDNSITKQRFWGTPVPIWQSIETGKGVGKEVGKEIGKENKEYIVVGSVAELERLSGKKVTELHLPDIDEITITRKGKVYRRIPDVLDVWIDAGTVSWNCLDYPRKKALFQKLFPADFILEGKDQIRGWYNLLMITSFLALGKPSFRSVYMHGFVTDVQGEKMSKSLGNIISPYEIIDKHGADVLRYYMCQTNAGEDINFSWEETALKQRNLNILWNLHKLLLNLAAENKMNPFRLDGRRLSRVLEVEERYIFSRLHSTIKLVTELLESYRLDEIIAPLEGLFLDLSRNYVQMVREKSSIGDEAEKELCIFTISEVLMKTLRMFSLICPFISEAIYLNLRQEFRLKEEGIMKKIKEIKEESINFWSWPAVDKAKINPALENSVQLAQEIMQAALNGRERAKLGLRWPVKEVLVETRSEEIKKAVADLQLVLQKQLNAKVVKVVETVPGVKMTVKPEYGKIGPLYGDLSPTIMTRLKVDSPETVLNHLEKENVYVFRLDGHEVKIQRDMVRIERVIPPPLFGSEIGKGVVYVNAERTEELEGEGYVRELMRSIQQLRKDWELEKLDRINLLVEVSPWLKPAVERWKLEIEQKVGAERMEITIHETDRQPGTRPNRQEKEVLIKKEKIVIIMEKW